nr:nucleotidyltransferase family protein [Thiocystis violacea]
MLAAGEARRFGGNKLLARMPDGEPMALKAARHLMATGIEALVVIRPGDAALAGMMRAAGLGLVENPDADQGMATSIAKGVAQASDADAWLIVLADMPWIRPQTIRRVLDALDAGAQIAAPTVNGRRGHPVGFAKGYRQALMALRGERGASRLVQASSSGLVLVPTMDTGILMDVDEPADLHLEAERAGIVSGGPD